MTSLLGVETQSKIPTPGWRIHPNGAAIINEWKQNSGADCAWLTYSANYLFRTAGVRWALDPFSLFTRVGGGPQPDFAADLAGLQLVVLTHAHNDHLDLNLVTAIRELPLTWVIPEFMLPGVMQAADLPRERILIPEPGKPIQVGGLTLTPFTALHFRGTRGVPEMGYLAEFSGKRWLFPGDTRSYTADRLPDFGKLDGAFAHLWLGKAAALLETPPLLPDFCGFFSQLNPARLVITHLDELGRDEPELWEEHHFRMARKRNAAI